VTYREWELQIDPDAAEDLRRLDGSVRKRIKKFLDERLLSLENPRSIGEALKGSRLGDLWKYRVGDYRIFARIEDHTVIILVVKVGHRREVYR
jgi:mRNA interferase RelE/StbE